MPVCDSCLTAAYDETGTESLAEQKLVCATMGKDLADHICEARDNGRKCTCGCNQN